MSRETSLFKNTIILTIGTFLPRVINILTTPILTAYMKQGELGIIGFINNMILAFIVPICSLQLEQAFFRFLIDAKTEEDKKRVITSGFVAIFIIMLLLGIITLFVPVTGFTGGYKLLLIGYIWIEILCQMARFILRAFSLYKQYSVFATLAVVVNFISVVFCFIIIETGYHGMLISLAVADLVGIIYVLFRSPILRYIRFNFYDTQTLKEMLRYSLPFVPNMIAWSANLAADQFLINSILGSAANGIYIAANKIPSIVSMLYPAFNLAWTESASLSVGDKDTSQYYSKMFKMIFCILSGGTALLLAASPYLFSFLVNDTFIEAKQYLPTLIIATYIYCFAQFFSSIYIALKESKNMTISTAISAVSNILINLSLIYIIGLQAAVISSIISNLLLAGYRYYDINHNYYQMRVNKRLLVLTIVVMVIQTALFWSNNGITDFLNIVLAIGFAYFICGDIVKPLITSLILKRSR